MYLALIENGSYLELPNPVPFRDFTGPVERGLLNEAGRLSGRAQSAIRELSTEDFARILNRGFRDLDDHLPRTDNAATYGELEEEQEPFLHQEPGDRLRYFTSREVRDRAFRRVVLDNYDQRCAVTGLKFINGGGRAEVNAAHIQPVQFGGPDSLQNGIALSATAHWTFDRGLISLADDFEVLISRQVNDPDGIRTFTNSSGYALLPSATKSRPHPRFLAWHRENIFKH